MVDYVNRHAYVVSSVLITGIWYKYPFENGYGWEMRRRSKLPMLTKIMASETSHRSS
jgi:hypothetical protein